MRTLNTETRACVPERGSRQRTSLIAPALAGTLAVLLSQSAANAQSVRNVVEDQACRSCRIELLHLTTLRDREPSWFGAGLTVSRDSRGRYHAADSFVSPGELHVVSAAGELIKSYGRAGEGPGEGRGVGAPYIGPRDTAYAYDFMLQRFAVWSPDQELVRTFKAPGRIGDALVFANGVMVVVGQIPDRNSAGLPLHVLDTRDGSIVRSFGTATPAARSAAQMLNARRLAPAGPDRFWAVHITQYRIEQWDLSGRKMLELRREAAWFPQHDGRSTAGVAPRPLVSDIWQDADGLLWVMITVSDPAYQRNREKLTSAGGERLVKPGDRDGLRDTILEVIDVTSWRLLASRRFDTFHTSWARGPLQVYRENEDGIPRYELYVPRLVR